jgi:hypothetical protein
VTVLDQRRLDLRHPLAGEPSGEDVEALKFDRGSGPVSQPLPTPCAEAGSSRCYGIRLTEAKGGSIERQQ